MRALADGLLRTALAAARLQMAHFSTGVAVETKPDNSPVTIADRQSEAVILEGLAEVAPGVPVVSEEEAGEGRVPATGGSFFLVDPIDGTKPFIRGSNEFTINIALIVARRPVFGLVYAPAIPDFYVTTGPGETLGGRIAPSSRAQSLAECDVGPLRTQVPDPNALRALVSQSHRDHRTQRFLDDYNVIEQRAVSSSLKFGLMARGEADIYPRICQTSEWDTAAGQAVLAGAGGCVTMLEGEPLLYGKAGFLNPDFVAWGRAFMPRQR
jgi:3'(2'), 5'-bisphosphate nucleotidase